ncbi:MAG TPA: Gfo/Idh/MocA family oxidoreductase [Candidatus Lokiarchaeia archaeon]|nr:Gfo/Idh/MocA family oxidoreductase [Candidatus Lokiarchaeia archaeon]
MVAKNKVHIGIAGCGMIAHNVLMLSKIDRMRDVQFIACMDVDVQAAQQIAKRFGIRNVHVDYESLITDPEIEAIYIAVPHHLHRDLVTRAIEAGKHVLCEKPIATSLEDGIAMARLADDAGIKLGINYMYRYNGGLFKMVDSVRAGLLGKPYYATIQLPWSRPASYFENSPWHKKWETSGGGTLITQASHVIDLMAWALGKPASISGEIGTFKFGDIGVEVEDIGVGTIKFASGAIATILGSQATRPPKHTQIGFYGEKGSIECTYWHDIIARVKYRGIRPVRAHAPTRGLHALTRSFRGFARWILDGTPYLCNGWEALKPLFIVLSIYESAKDGTKIHCPELDWWH